MNKRHRFLYNVIVVTWIASFGSAARLYAIGHCCQSGQCQAGECCACCSESTSSVPCVNGHCQAKCSSGGCSGTAIAKCDPL